MNCKIETNLVGVVVGVTSECQEQFIRENQSELHELKRWLDAVTRNSERVLEEAGR